MFVNANTVAPTSEVDKALQAYKALSNAADQMDPVVNTRAITVKENLLANASWKEQSTCIVCGYPGHNGDFSSSAENNEYTNQGGCRQAIIKTVEFWDYILKHLRVLHEHSAQFRKALVDNRVTADMVIYRVDPPQPRLIDGRILRSLTKNYLLFQSMHDIKFNIVMRQYPAGLARYHKVCEGVNQLLLHGRSYSQIGEEPVTLNREDARRIRAATPCVGTLTH